MSNGIWAKSIFHKDMIPKISEGKTTTIHVFLRDNQYRGKLAIRLASFHPVYCFVLGMEEWIDCLKGFNINASHYGNYGDNLTLNDYATSVYHHASVMEHFEKFPRQKKFDFLTTYLEFQKETYELKGAIALPLTASAEIGNIYQYKRPKKKDRDLFIMSNSKRVYLNGLSSVFETKRIRKNAVLYHIKSKRCDANMKYLRGMNMIHFLKPHLLKCRPILEKLLSFYCP